MRLGRPIVLLVLSVSFALWMGCGTNYRDEAGAAANLEVAGTLSLRGGHPAPMLLLEAREGKEYLLRSSSLSEELKRLNGMAVLVRGTTPAGTQAPFPVLEVRSYRLLPLPGGEQPAVGTVRLRDSECFIEMEDGTDVRIEGEFASVLAKYAGAKVWVIGEASREDPAIFVVKGYGIIVPSESAP